MFGELIPLLLLIISAELMNTDQFSPPDNPFYARIQSYLSPFKVNTEAGLTCTQLIEYHGFKSEKHFVFTDDGYILEIYRIVKPSSKNTKNKDKLIPVLLVHGILVSCGSWMFNTHVKPTKGQKNRFRSNSESNDLAFALADHGYDVWIANSRGTSYSLNHTSLSYHDSEFWDFDFVSMGRYDNPAMIDYILKITKYEKLVYIGYSQGTQSMLTLLAERPSFVNKLYLNILISPIGFYNNPKGLVEIIPRTRSFYLALGEYVGPLPPFMPEFNAGLTVFCSFKWLKPICKNVYKYIFGPDPKMIDSHHFPVITSLIDKTSNRNALHNLQSFNFGQLRYYDFGDEKNYKIYKSKFPPKINFTNVPTHNLVLISGLRDYLAKQKNVQRLLNILQHRPLINHVVTYPKWCHTDPIFGNRAFEFLHLPIIKIIRKYVVPK